MVVALSEKLLSVSWPATAALAALRADDSSWPGGRHDRGAGALAGGAVQVLPLVVDDAELPDRQQQDQQHRQDDRHLDDRLALLVCAAISITVCIPGGGRDALAPIGTGEHGLECVGTCGGGGGALRFSSRGSERWRFCLLRRWRRLRVRAAWAVRFRVVPMLSIPSPGDPFLINSGPIHARWYGLLLAVGVLIAGWIARREFRRRSIDPELAYVDRGVGGAVRPGRRPPLPRRHRLGRVPPRPVAGAGDLERRPLHLRRGAGRHARHLDRQPPRGPAVLGGGRLHRPRPDPGPGAGPLGQLLQPGAVRQAHRPAVGARDRPRPPGARPTRTRPPSSPCSCTSRS